MSFIFDLLSQSIVPVYIRHSEGKPRWLTFEGTAFFVKLESKLALVTAAHVGIQPGRQNKDVLIIPERLTANGQSNAIECEGDAVINQKEDFFALMLYDSTLSKFRNLPKPLKIITTELEPLNDVFAFGYPFTDVIVDHDVTTGITAHNSRIQPIFVKGYVMRTIKRQVILDRVPRCFETNYVLNFPSYPGLSGAPLLTQIGNEICAAGLLYGNLQTSFFRGPIEIERHENEGVEKQVWAQYDFALASTHEAINAVIPYLPQTQQK